MKHLPCLLLLLLPALAAGAADNPRFALAVSSSEGRAGRARLWFPGEDVQRLSAALSDVGGFDGSRLRVLRDPSLPALRAALEGDAETGGVRQVVFVTVRFDYYTHDFVQNDPFLRAPVIFLASRGRAADEALLRERFPGARLAAEAPFGHVWRLD